ncbi:amidohydrolase family protein [Mariniluteicoccus endophyticus]
MNDPHGTPGADEGWHSHGPGHLHRHPQPHRADDGSPKPRLHLHGIVLPDEQPVDLWVVDGHITYSQVAGAETICRDAWILPGMVDAHCHIGLDSGGAVEREVAEEQALAEVGAGALLVRDAGSPSDTRWIDEREDLPRVVRAGRHIARTKRYIRNYADEVEPEGLVESVERQVATGDGWIKLVGDWIDRAEGDLKPLWPKDTLDAAIGRAHELGARVTAHHFGEEGLDDLLDAGIDGIEHGTGLGDDQIAKMAERQVSLVPTLINLENFPDIAASGEEKFPQYAAHMRDLYARRRETFTKAFEAGVPIYAGTDAGGVMPHGIIGREIEMLAEVGGNEFALGAGSWRARNWLGFAGLEEGAPADLVVFERDPRSDISVVREPSRVVLRGRVVG